jgi:hypothetical protein
MVNTSALDILTPPRFDSTIVSKEYRTYLPFASTSYDNDDAIRILISNQDAITYPGDSYLVIEGEFKRKQGDTADFPNTHKIVSNGLMHLFSDIRYEINGVEVDHIKNPGIATTMKAYPSIFEAQRNVYSMSGLETNEIFNRKTGYFCSILPLKNIMGFFEDFKGILLHVRQELILIRANVDTNVYITADADKAKYSLQLNRVSWRIRHITTNVAETLRLTNILNQDPWIPIQFMTWELHEYPYLNLTDYHTWSVKTAPRFESPRFIILGFQTARKNDATKDAAEYDHLNLQEAKAYLNTVPYPYDNLNLDYDKGNYLPLYAMFTEFQASYYDTDIQPIVSYEDYKKMCPLVVFDCSKQDESTKTGPVDIRLEWKTKAAVSANTSAYCLILHDRVINYRPLTSKVQIL